jgi:hypothetical protein
VSTVWASISVSYALVVGRNRDGTKTPVRRACIGSIASLWRYDAGPCYTLQSAGLRRRMIPEYESRVACRIIAYLRQARRPPTRVCIAVQAGSTLGAAMRREKVAG